MALVELTNLVKRFGRTTAVDDVSLVLPEGSFTAVLGPSGCGKTTLLRLLAGLERPTSGQIVVGGRDVTRTPPEKRNFGMMFQSYALMPHMTVSENLRFPLRMRKQGSREEQRRLVEEAMALVRLEELGARYPRQLSGGQQQRVALARAMISRPPLLLLDEPLSNLDAKLRKEMQVEIIELHNKVGLTTIFVTHDQEEALSLSNHVVLMRDGRVEQTGAPQEIYDHPATAFAAEFIGGANLLDATLVRDGQGSLRAELAPGLSVPVAGGGDRAEGPCKLALRQEDLVLSEAPEANQVSVPARLVARVYQGASNRYVADVAGQRVTVHAAKSSLASDGEALNLCWDPDAAILL